MSVQTTQPVTLKNAAGEEITVDIRIPSKATLAMRERVDKFIRRSYAIWKEQPAEDTVLVATPAVLDEVVHTATAFHANDQGTVDLVWVKKDMPLEALKDADVGYWRAAAGPGPRLEQLEMCLIRDIPGPVMAEIRHNNNHDMIAHFLYAFIDFWCIVLKHWIIWLACIFWYGYLCLLQPTIIVGESSKLFNLVRHLTPQVLFNPEFNEDDFNAFLNGHFNLAFLQHLVVGIERREWDEYEMNTSDYIHSTGIPVIQAYGPFARHFAIYIPKIDPYAPYHMRSVSQYMVEVDRFVRLMIELAHDIVLEASPIPLDGTRKACLIEVRSRIIQEASRIGLLAKLNAAKAKLAMANKGFNGPKGAAQYARVAAEVASGSRDSPSAARGRPNRGDINAVGAKESPQRKAWAVQEINKLRDQLESGLCIGLLACPRQYQHGTVEHAQWLYMHCTEGAEVINSAVGFAHRGRTANPSPEDEMRLTALADATSAACILPDTMTVTALEALKILALPPKERKMSQIYLCICPFCSKRWLVNDGTNFTYHDCIEIRKKYLPGLAASLHSKKALETQMEADEKDEQLDPLQKKSGVTRCIAPITFEWTAGERITGDEDIFSATFQKKKLARRPNQSAPAWERAIDERGRLSSFSLERHRLAYSYQLLQLPEAACLFRSVESSNSPQEPIQAGGPSELASEQATSVEKASAPLREPIPLSGYEFGSVPDVLTRVNIKSSLSAEVAKKAAESWLVWKVESKSTKEETKSTKDDSKSIKDESKSTKEVSSSTIDGNKLIKKMLEDAVKAWVKGEKPVLKAPEFGLEDIMAAAEKRTGINRLRPHHFDPDTMDDLLPGLIASIASSSGSATISYVSAATPTASTSAISQETESL